MKAAVRAGQRALVQLRADGISCDLYARSFDLTDQTVTYEVVVFNRTPIGIFCRLYGVESTMHTRELGMLAVPANSASSSFFVVPLERRERRRIFVEAMGEGVNLYAEALQPVAPAASPWTFAWIATVAAALAVTAGCCYEFARPSIVAFDVPVRSTDGTVRALYSLGGIQTARYQATLPDGRVFAHGPLAKRSGELTIAVPEGTEGDALRLTIEAQGPLGYTARSTLLRVLPDAIADVDTVVDRDSSIPSITGVPVRSVGTAPSAAEVFNIPDRVVAGRPFDVFIGRPQPDLHVSFRDDLDATVDDVHVPAGAGRISLTAPAAASVQTYTLTGTFDHGATARTVVRSLRVYP